MRYVRRGSKLVVIGDSGDEQTLLISPLRLVLSFGRKDLVKVVDVCRRHNITSASGIKTYVKHVAFGIDKVDNDSKEEEL